MTRLVCPPTMQPHAAKVLAGEYDVPGLELPPGAIVLDIGANVGAFTIWAKRRWPGCKVIAYEPHPDNARMFRENCPDVRLHEVAVYGKPGRMSVTLYDGKNNCGEASVFRMEEQTGVSRMVSAMHPSDLPACDLIKLDTEGCEFHILKRYSAMTSARAVMLEWHASRDRWGIGHLLAEEGFRCVRDEVNSEHRGIMCWRKP